MNYIYDIVLNFQNHYYQFFEWDKKDRIKNITKIPVYRVSDKNLLILMNNKVKIDSIFLNKIKEDNKKYKKNMCLVSNTQIAIGLLFDDKGILQKRSSLLYEEENEVNDFCKNLLQTEIIYIENIEISPQHKLRFEVEKNEALMKYITNSNDTITLKYLYYEYFKVECEDEEKIKKELIKELKNNWTKKQNNLYKIVKILNKNSQLAN